MQNDSLKENLSARIIALVEKLPFFAINNLKITNVSSHYLKIILSRYAKAGKLINLKKGLYTSQKYVSYVKEKNKYHSFLEFLATEIYSFSYLSLEYILYEHNILTDIPVNFTLMTKNKPTCFVNKLETFIYHKIKNELFLGFETIQKGDFIIYKATKAKALFDYLYLRKNLLVDKKALEELRLNLDELTTTDKKELKKYITIEGSKKMKQIFDLLWEKK